MDPTAPAAELSSPPDPDEVTYSQLSVEFDRLDTLVPHPPRPCSTNDELAVQGERRRYSHEAKGMILLLQRSGLIVVPHTMNTGGGYYATVVHGDKSYPRGGYDIDVSRKEIETAIELRPKVNGAHGVSVH